ncbi:MAG: hypothetical protein B655_1571 [Methanobacterium sp. Maddingley MBC34]|nr:MAG: hypothetical protein B655_1571 [Methanobacterium sp. Maddingley MBC34]
MSSYNTLFIEVIFALLFILPLMIYINFRKNKTAALGLLFTNKNKTIRAFQLFAVAMIVYALSMVILLLYDVYNISTLITLYIIISIILALLLIYVFYKLYKIMKLTNY